jgi:hypothetical protein
LRYREDLMGEETMTVVKAYKLKVDVQAGRWTAERVGEDAWYVVLEEGDIKLWLPNREFRAMFDENEMTVEMTAEELEGERTGVRKSRDELRDGEYA